MSKFIAVCLFSVLSFSLAIPAQAQIDSMIWDQIHRQRQRDQINRYGGDMCRTILESSWRYYTRQRAAGIYSYPNAGNIRMQRKLERENGCPHLYNEDGTVNRVPGINADS
jgi:hypothetical protein